MTKVEALAAKVRTMSPPDRLRLAAGLIEQGRMDLARTLIVGVKLELDALKLFGKQR